MIESRAFRESGSKLTIALGKTIDGLNYCADLAKMPHLLIAGTTGAGKSVGVNALIVSILYRARPDEVKFILIDPKRLELGLYEDIPHLAAPIITDPKVAARSLKWAVKEMEQRYKDLAGWGVRNIDGYNTEIMRRNLVKEYDDAGEPWKPLPFIVIIIDELADLMMTSGHEVEESSPAWRRWLARSHSSCVGDAAALSRRDNRLNQGKLPVAYFFPSLVQGRFAHNHRYKRRRTPARSRRHAVSATGDIPTHPRPWRLHR